MKDTRTLATFGGKIFFFAAALVLLLAIVLWPYVTTPRRYEIKEIPPITTEETTQPEDSVDVPASKQDKSSSSAPEHTNYDISEDINEGEMVFQGKTELIITPKQ